MRVCTFFFVTLLPSLIASGQAVDPANSSVQQRIQAAEKRVQTNPGSWQSYNDLAFALLRKARDGNDPAVFDLAEQALQHSRKLSADNYEAQKLEVAVLLGRQEFSRALTLATELNKKVRDDISGWGLLVDSNVALGKYAEAETAAQWILDLRPGSSLGFEKAAGLRDLFGDPEGAIEFYNEANRRTSQNDLDQRAWLLLQMARVQITKGDRKGAQDSLSQALALFPGSQLAVSVSAKLEAAGGDYAASASLLEKRYRNTPTPGNLYDWALSLDKASMKGEAATAFADFEKKALGDTKKPNNENLDLIYFYTDYKSSPGEALQLAVSESTRRHDVATLDAYAWALYKNGKYGEAKTQMDRALAVGIADPLYFCHAAQIAAKSDDTNALAKYETELKSRGAQSCLAEQPVQAAREVAP